MAGHLLVYLFVSYKGNQKTENSRSFHTCPRRKRKIVYNDVSPSSISKRGIRFSRITADRIGFKRGSLPARMPAFTVALGYGENDG